MSETIFALATPPGRAGVSVIRASGPAAFAGMQQITRIKNEIAPRYAVFTGFYNPVSGRLLDRGVVLFFKGPASFTGEDVVEYQLHGSPAVVRSLLTVLSGLEGYRLAEPGEFTRRAFENGKMDLTEAEAVADLIHAETALQQEQALAQMGGALSCLYNEWTEELKYTLAHLEADLEFPDEDLPDGLWPQLRPNLERLRESITGHLNDGRRGEILREGVKVAVIGAPNAGKSSLVNLLAQRDVAIVSDLAGTTRDVIEVHLDLGGYPVILSDTAGLRPELIGGSGQEGIEQEGIRRALKTAADADFCLLVFDASRLPEIDHHTKKLLDEKAERTLAVFNKCDECEARFTHLGEKPVFMISVKTGDGISGLLTALADKIEALAGHREGPSLTRRRHRASLQDCVAALDRALSQNLPELIAEDVRLAMRALGRITGRVDVEDLLDVIFRDFCIGK